MNELFFIEHLHYQCEQTKLDVIFVMSNHVTKIQQILPQSNGIHISSIWILLVWLFEHRPLQLVMRIIHQIQAICQSAVHRRFLIAWENL